MSDKHGVGTDRRNRLRKIAEETLDVIKYGSYSLPDPKSSVPRQISLKAQVQSLKNGTHYYAGDSLLSSWSQPRSAQTLRTNVVTELSLLEVSTIEGIRLLADALAADNVVAKIGLLNFASAKKPGGGFINGAQAQEESLARSSTLYSSLMTTNGQKFYAAHKRDPKDGYYSHAMIYSPGTVFFRDDQGRWIEPVETDVLVSAAVNAGVARRAGAGSEAKIAEVMKERMGRLLFLFSQQGVKNLVLGSFGTGVFQNNVETVSQLWADLLLADGARFKHSFDRIIFAILGTETFQTFKATFEKYGQC